MDELLDQLEDLQGVMWYLKEAHDAILGYKEYSALRDDITEIISVAQDEYIQLEEEFKRRYPPDTWSLSI